MEKGDTSELQTIKRERGCKCLLTLQGTVHSLKIISKIKTYRRKQPRKGCAMWCNKKVEGLVQRAEGLLKKKSSPGTKGLWKKTMLQFLGIIMWWFWHNLMCAIHFHERWSLPPPILALLSARSSKGAGFICSYCGYQPVCWRSVDKVREFVLTHAKKKEISMNITITCKCN